MKSSATAIAALIGIAFAAAFASTAAAENLPRTPQPIDDIAGNTPPQKGPLVGGSYSGPVKPPAPPPGRGSTKIMIVLTDGNPGAAQRQRAGDAKIATRAAQRR